MVKHSFSTLLLLSFFGVVAFVLFTNYQPLYILRQAVYQVNISELFHGIANFSIIPNETNTYTLGNSTRIWAGLYANNIYINRIYPYGFGKVWTLAPIYGTAFYQNNSLLISNVQCISPLLCSKENDVVTVQANMTYLDSRYLNENTISYVAQYDLGYLKPHGDVQCGKYAFIGYRNSPMVTRVDLSNGDTLNIFGANVYGFEFGVLVGKDVYFAGANPNDYHLKIYVIPNCGTTITLWAEFPSINAQYSPAFQTDGKYFYFATFTDPSTLYKIDITTKQVVASKTLDNCPYAHGSIFYNGYLYLGCGTKFLKVDPNTLEPMVYVDVGHTITDDIAVKDGLIYLGTEYVYTPFYVVNAADLSIVGTIPKDGVSYGCETRGGAVFCLENYVINRNYGRLYVITSPRTYKIYPLYFGSWTATIFNPNEVFYYNGTIWITDWYVISGTRPSYFFELKLNTDDKYFSGLGADEIRAGIIDTDKLILNGKEYDTIITREDVDKTVSEASSQLQQYIMGNKSEVISYVDNNINGNVSELRNYVDSQVTEKSSELQNYVDTNIASNISEVKNYVDTNINGNISAVEDYVDNNIESNVSELRNELTDYVDSNINDNVSKLKSYVDQNILGNTTIIAYFIPRMARKNTQTTASTYLDSYGHFRWGTTYLNGWALIPNDLLSQLGGNHIYVRICGSGRTSSSSCPLYVGLIEAFSLKAFDLYTISSTGWRYFCTPWYDLVDLFGNYRAPTNWYAIMVVFRSGCEGTYVYLQDNTNLEVKIVK